VRLTAPAADPFASHADVSTFYASYSAALSDNRIADWPDFFTKTCRYDVISRSNYERGLPLATMRYHSRGALVDRVAALDNTLVYAPRAISHMVGSVLVLTQTAHVLSCRSSFAVYQTMLSGESHLLMAGRTFDDIEVTDGSLHFSKRVVVYDSDRISGALVYPV
jgi:salicylate 5-hydroxylase small subunit